MTGLSYEQRNILQAAADQLDEISDRLEAAGFKKFAELVFDASLDIQFELDDDWRLKTE